MPAKADIERYRANLRDELNGAALYEALALGETDPLRKDLFMQLAQAESRHAQLWRGKLAAVGIQDERFVPVSVRAYWVRPSFKR